MSASIASRSWGGAHTRRKNSTGSRSARAAGDSSGGSDDVPVAAPVTEPMSAMVIRGEGEAMRRGDALGRSGCRVRVRLARLARLSRLGAHERHDGVGMPVAHAVFGLEAIHDLHVRERV